MTKEYTLCVGFTRGTVWQTAFCTTKATEEIESTQQSNNNLLIKINTKDRLPQWAEFIVEQHDDMLSWLYINSKVKVYSAINI